MNGTGKWVAAALTVSIVLNIFFAAFLIGRHLGHEEPHRHGRHGETLTMRLELKALGAALSEEARQALRESMRARRDEVLPKIAAIHEARGEIVRLLSAKELDEAALQASFDRLAQGLVDLQRPLEATIVEAARKMTPEERRRMAAALTELQERYDRRRDGEADRGAEKDRPNRAGDRRN